MLNNLKIIIGVGVLGYLAYTFLAPQGEQTADLGAVLDRTEFALTQYQEHLKENSVSEASEDQVEEFRTYLVDVMNADPRFYEKTQGMEIQKDATFLAFADDNGNGVKDAGEGDIYTVEIDEANNRLIATDMSGNSSGLRFSGAGFLAGALLGSLLNRQRAAGVKPDRFNNRTVTPRSSYQAPRSARPRSGGLRAGK